MRRSLVGAAVARLLAASGVAVPAAPASADDEPATGRISGRITDAFGAPLDEIFVAVRFYDPSFHEWNRAALATTGELAAPGTWEIDLPPGTYRIEFSDWGDRFDDGFWEGATTIAEARTTSPSSTRIRGATSRTFRPGPALRGSSIAVVVTASAPGYRPRTVRSRAKVVRP